MEASLNVFPLKRGRGTHGDAPVTRDAAGAGGELCGPASALSQRCWRRSRSGSAEGRKSVQHFLTRLTPRSLRAARRDARLLDGNGAGGARSCCLASADAARAVYLL
ncbi:hypothetical protein AOLI_G00219020 [Acnodon oligacanthus]